MSRIPSMIAVSAMGLFLLTARPAQAAPPEKIAINEARFAQLDPADQQRVLAVKERLEAIAAVDRSTLTRAEKRELRAEARAARAEADALNRGGTVIYLSTGAIILILLLIILL
ncbi:MAG: hypothetical protein JST66_03885 [Bacteroidetes bacterium]|nr:hypothetical protein [Bacteroidota bacterium]